jgi:pimeloyl-ACP methyl ester carboxylesterase
MGVERTLTILVHGLWMPSAFMELQRRHLDQMGFDAVVYTYPTMRLSLTENADRLAGYAAATGAPAIHWVGHSMGGLLILHMLARTPGMVPGRVVMQGTPYHGSYAARTLAQFDFGAHLLGRSMQEWDEIDKPAAYPGREIGVIAGSLGLGLGRLIAWGLPEPNDGVVSVEETELPEARDHIVLPVSHSGMLLAKSVVHQTGAFLREGRFDHHAEASHA